MECELRQRTINIISGFSCLILLYSSLHIILFIPPGSRIRPVGQGIWLFCIGIPCTFIMGLKALKQLRMTWPGREGFVAMFVALLPILLFVSLELWIQFIMQIEYAE
ncbi:MAG TPA: hypothetical protein DIW81_22225 [Planctomycetaceae bacterium]|nr:hypothetical protein [Planctomycetaceae bacterium]